MLLSNPTFKNIIMQKRGFPIGIEKHSFGFTHTSTSVKLPSFLSLGRGAEHVPRN